MPRNDEFDRQVVEIIARKKKVAASSIRPESTFQELGIDSLDGIDLVFAFEDAYDVTIPDHVVRQMKTVRDVVDALGQEIEKRPRPAG
jgi:acyl carrier protein